MNWLDTETKSILWKEPESKLAPPKAGEFDLILFKEGTDFKRVVRAICRTTKHMEPKARQLACSRPPYTVALRLTEAEAIYGQFELICCDSISAFFRSGIVSGINMPNHLDALFRNILASPEFRPVNIDVISIPQNESGEEFVDQFLGLPFPPKTPLTNITVPFKKARIMKHWADRIAVQVKCSALHNSDQGLSAP